MKHFETILFDAKTKTTLNMIKIGHTFLFSEIGLTRQWNKCGVIFLNINRFIGHSNEQRKHINPPLQRISNYFYNGALNKTFSITFNAFTVLASLMCTFANVSIKRTCLYQSAAINVVEIVHES